MIPSPPIRLSTQWFPTDTIAISWNKEQINEHKESPLLQLRTFFDEINFVKPKGFIYLCNQKVSFMRRDVFQAIADPTRREILNRIAHQPLNVNAVTEHFDVSRTAIYKHIKILIECGLIDMKQKGREHICEARLEKLNEVSEWVEQYRAMWENKLDALERYLDELQTKEEGKPKHKKHGKHK